MDENNNSIVINLRQNRFTCTINNCVLNFINMCPLNSIIHAFMHIHVHCKSLTEMPERNHEFYQLVSGLFNLSFEDGNRRIANFIKEKFLFSNETSHQVDCTEHVELIIEKIHVPLSASLYCHICNMDRDFQ